MNEMEFNPIKFEKDTWEDRKGYFIADFDTNEFTYANKEYVYTCVVFESLLSGVIAKAIQRGTETCICDIKIMVKGNQLIFGRKSGVIEYLSLGE